MGETIQKLEENENIDEGLNIKNLFEDISPLIKKEEQLIFEKLKNETFNFTNSLKLLLGKKIRIQAKQ